MCPDEAKQDLYHSGLEGEHYFVFVVELTLLPPDARVSMAVQVTCRRMIAPVGNVCLAALIRIVVAF